MIFHIDTGKTWRGGQQQSFSLHQHLCQNDYNSLMICKRNSAMSIKCKENNLPFECLPLLSEIDIYSAFRLAHLARKKKASIFHLHTAHALSIGLTAKLFYRNLILIAVRRVDFSIKKSIFSSFKYKTKFLDKIVCVSENIKNVMIRDGLPFEKLRLIYSGIDIDRYSVQNFTDLAALRNHYKIPCDNIVIGTIAAFVGHKDYPTLLKAARILINKYKNLTFIAVGDGRLFPEIEKYHKELELGNSFILAGFQTDIKSFLHLFEIFVLSSNKEGLGTSILDAMSARKAIVACNSGGIPEMIKDKENGLLAEKENPEDLAEKIEILINNEQLRKKLGLQAEIDVKDFSINKTYMDNVALYKEMMK